MPRLAAAVIDALIHKGKCFSALIQMLGARSAAERLAELLVLMAELESRASADGVIVGRRQTQDDLAKLVGATFREDGLVEVTPRHILRISEKWSPVFGQKSC